MAQPPSTSEATPRVALITGAARRLGRAIALGLAADGWDIAVHYGTSAAAAAELVARLEELGRRAVALRCDLEDPAGAGALLDACAQSLGEARCVVNNASLFAFDAAQSFEVAQMDRHMRVNLYAPLVLARELARRAARAGFDDAVVVNLLDQKLINPNPDFFTYTLSKAALQTATTLLAQALGPTLRVVGVAPGITLAAPGQSEASFASAWTRTPLGRGSTPEDVVGAVRYAIGARGVTGTTLVVDGGQHLVPSRRDVMFEED